MAVSSAGAGFGSCNLGEDVHQDLSVKQRPVRCHHAISGRRGVRLPQSAAFLFLNGAENSTGFSSVNPPFDRTEDQQAVPRARHLTQEDPSARSSGNISAVGHGVNDSYTSWREVYL